ncbi:hypothetical protein SLS62_003431 [Diatrype stigma]|uniref:EGF-like domain-containing protein n=1 Tax=Diatrype stigma TaxID=117547 RepID=A0AAN9UWM0_9PEZI
MSGFRRPPRLDIDAVRDAEARGSLTSLPDLIRRATRLASMIDKGRRPTSQFNELDFPEAMYARNRNRDTYDNVPAEPATEDCKDQLTCANGGTVVITQGKCMCICSVGFIGPTCTLPSAQGCTTTSIETPDSTINDATVGQAIPRLLENARTNFSIPLSATELTAKFNSANLSCNTQNALVTFDGQALRLQNNLVNSDVGIGADLVEADITTVLPDSDLTITISNPAITNGADLVVSTFSSEPTFSGSVSTVLDTTLSPPYQKETGYPTTKVPTLTPTPTTSSTVGPSSTTATPQPTNTFTVNDEMIDFARAAVLFIFQQETLSDAATAQTSLQKFITSVDSDTTGTTAEKAANLTIGGTNTIDLVNLFLDLGGDRVGGGPSS